MKETLEIAVMVAAIYLLVIGSIFATAVTFNIVRDWFK